MEDGKAIPPCTAGWMGRAAVAKVLEMSISGVRRLEGRVLHPVRGEDGVWYFDPAAVRAARRRVTGAQGPTPPLPDTDAASDGELAARLFPLFERRASFAEVIATTRARPAQVRALFWEWQQGYRRPSLTHAEADEREDEPADDAPCDEQGFAAWEAEVRALDREQARIDHFARRFRRR